MISAEDDSALLTAGLTLQVAATWDGCPLPSNELVDFSVRLDTECLLVTVTAPFYADPPPPGPGGEMPGLWEYEVVELFLVGEGGHYLEIELGPHGHYLLLLLSGVRQVKKQLPALYCESRISGRNWQGSIRVDRCLLPLPFRRLNAFAIHGQGGKRRYLAAFPLPGEKPDFHQPRGFPAVAEVAGRFSCSVP